jgi:hypothetical protein
VKVISSPAALPSLVTQTPTSSKTMNQTMTKMPKSSSSDITPAVFVPATDLLQPSLLYIKLQSLKFDLIPDSASNFEPIFITFSLYVFFFFF